MSLSSMARTSLRSLHFQRAAIVSHSPFAVHPTSSCSPRCCISNTAVRSIASTSTAPQQLPWFVQDEPEPSPSSPSSSSSSSSSSASPSPPTIAPSRPPPDDIPTSLHPLHDHLVTSPFLDPRSIAYIDAQSADPGASWTDWIVVATLRHGRERGLRGAIEGVRAYLASNPIALSTNSSDRAFAPSHPTVTGLPNAPSRHVRSRNAGKGGGSTSTTADWAMVDAGDLVVHVMTADAREVWGIEGLWEAVGRDNQRQQEKYEAEQGGGQKL
ncbi:BQ5605_C012g06902 [Microbotryum silenes-dioicae]|uniref:BQ5605_C012g06902 protein n=1 Tax=Microbotryum silenes-dioicae TaxID=796604 RepID=A0A2X0LWV6_9BASI|nr:BQ5605_C012g06902 [Microbotryum silenes-dioicae]